MLARLTIICIALCCWFADASSSCAQNTSAESWDQGFESLPIGKGTQIRQASPEEIESAVEVRNYQPVLKTQLFNLIQNANKHAEIQNDYDIIKAVYRANLTSQNALNGEVDFSFSSPPKAVRELGPTNLNGLKLFHKKQQLAIGKTQNETAMLLVSPNTRRVAGYWISQGQQQSENAIFDLQLPRAVISEFTLTTPLDVSVTSPNSLVVSAAPPQDNERTERTWILYPANSGRLTINCSNQSKSFVSTNRNIGCQADYRIQPDSCQARWNLSLPGLPLQSQVQFLFSEDVTPQSIIDGEQKALPFSWDSKQKSLTIHNSTDSPLSTIVINGQFASPKSNACLIPIFNKGTWKGPNQEVQGQLELSSATLRASFSSEMTVQSSILSGLMETDVEFTADGSQRLTMEQFAEPAKAEFQLMVPRPVLQDQIITRTTDELGQIEAFIQIENRSGVAETVQYEVPRKFRITAVRELNTELPVLFRISSGDPTSDTQPIEIFLRTPLSRNSQQLLQLTLQSTASDVSVAEAELKNSDYLRLTDVVIFDSERLPPEMRQIEGTSYSEFRTQSPWAPAIDNMMVFDRSQFPRTTTTADDDLGVTATIDHALSVVNETVRDVIQIRLTTATPLPTEITIQAADSGPLKLKLTDQLLGHSLQPKTNRRSANEWVLKLSQNEIKNTATITLECERPATGRHIPMFISLPSARTQTASLRMVNPSSNWSLIDRDGQTVANDVSYPDRIQETNFRIQVRNTRAPSQQIHGTATWILDQAPDSIRAAVLIQLSAFGISNRISLDIHEMRAKNIHCLINDQLTEVETSNGQLDLLVPNDGRDLQIQVLIQDVFIDVDSAEKFQLPTIRLNDRSLRGIDAIIIPPTGRTVTATATTSQIHIKNSTELGHSLQQSPSSDIQHFLARLEFRQQQVKSLFLTSVPDKKTPTLTLGHTQTLFAASCIAGCILVALMAIFGRYGSMTWMLTGLGILLAQSIRIAFPSLNPAPSIMTAAFAVAAVIVYFKKYARPQNLASQQHKSSPSQTVVMSIGILLTAVSQSQAARPQSSRPAVQPPTISSRITQSQALPPKRPNDILSPKQDSPIVFVPPEIASLLESAQTKTTGSPLFLDSEVTVNLLTQDSISATVISHIAVDSATDQLIELPVTGVTLIQCELDGNIVLPVKSGSDSDSNSKNPGILISAIPQPAARLSANANVIATDMKGWVAGLMVYELRYTVRMLAKPDMDGAKADLPLPPAPLTQIIVKDKTTSITEARLFTPKPHRGVRLGSEFNYPTFSHLTHVGMQFGFSTSEIETDKQPQESEIIARILATPTELKIDCDYEVRPVDIRSESVRIAQHNDMNLIGAAAADGTEITASVDDSMVTIQTPVDRQGLQKFKLAWQSPQTFAQEVSINTQELRQLNRIPANRLILVASTSDRFTIDSLQTNQTPLEPIPDNQIPSRLVLRPNEQAYLIPASVDAVTLQLSRLLETREASMNQLAVVERNRINWTCECELQIPDEPIFRQSLTVSADLKIQSISAKTNEIDRLQSWYRRGDQLVIGLREATRGSLAISINGTLPRHPQQDTPLPVVTLPSPVDVLEVSLSLSAADPESVFIRSLEGTIPNSEFRTQNIAVPTTPIRFTVTDETRPLIIRAEPTKAAQASVVALLTNQNEQTQIAIFMVFKAVESPFRLTLTKPSNVAYATSEVLLRPADERATSTNNAQASIDITAEGSVSDNDLSVIVITGIVPAMTSSVLNIPLPNFDAPCDFESFQVLDARYQDGITVVPRWVRNILPELPNATSLGNTNPLPATVNSERDQVRIQLPQTTLEQNKTSQENTPAYAISTHHITGDEYSIKGTFGVLAFSPAANATLKIALPTPAKLMQIRIDGKPAPFKFDSKSRVNVTLAERACLVEMEWLQSIPQNNMLNSSEIRLPTLVNVEGSTFTQQTLPESRWQLQNVVAAPIQTQDLLDEITSALQIIGTTQVTSPEPSPDTDLSQQNQSPDNPVWIQLRSQSPDTTDAYLRLLESLQETQPQLLLTQIDATHSVIEIRKRLPSSSLIIILAAIGMVVAGITTHSFTKTSLESTKT